MSHEAAIEVLALAAQIHKQQANELEHTEGTESERLYGHRRAESARRKANELQASIDILKAPPVPAPVEDDQ